MRCWRLLGSIVLFGMASGLAAEAAEGDQDLTAIIKALKQQVQDQGRRLSTLENRRPSPQAQFGKEQIRRIVAEIEEEDRDRHPTDFRMYWKEGIRFDSTDGDFKMKLGGRLMMDWTWANGEEIEHDLGIENRDGVEFRRARLYAAGTIYKCLGFKLQFDFAGGDADLKDAYLEFKKLAPGTFVRVGHYKEPFSLEELTSSKYITFMERSLPTLFAPSRNDGVMAMTALVGDKKHERMTAAVGLFRDANDYGLSQSDGGYNVTARVTGLPWYADGGKQLVHVGGGYSFRTPRDHHMFDGGSIRFRQRPEAHLLSRYVDTGHFEVDHVHLFGAETACVFGPFSAQAEYIAAVTGTDHAGRIDDPDFNGFYTYVSYFLTGEHRRYKNSAGAFSRVKPKQNFCKGGGWGAWEVAGRYSFLNLSGDGVDGDRLEDLTVGLNWYLNPNVRLMWNWVHPIVDEPVHDDSDSNLLMMRVQVDF